MLLVIIFVVLAFMVIIIYAMGIIIYATVILRRDKKSATCFSCSRITYTHLASWLSSRTRRELYSWLRSGNTFSAIKKVSVVTRAIVSVMDISKFTLAYHIIYSNVQRLVEKVVYIATFNHDKMND